MEQEREPDVGLRLLGLMGLSVLAWAIAAVVLGGAVRACAEPIVAASPLHAVVAPASQLYVDVAMGGVVLEGPRPQVSGIVYGPHGRRYTLRRKRLKADYSNHLALNLTPTSPPGVYTIYVTFERDTHAWGIPTRIEVAE